MTVKPNAPLTVRALLPTLLPALLLALVMSLLAVAATATASDTPVEDYAGYVGQTRCLPKPKPGAVALRAWTVARYGGRAGGISRSCGPGTSEHQEGRAFDWAVNAGKAADRARAQRWMTALFATGPSGEPHELARRMGVMYVIWNDRMYASCRGFTSTPYVSSSCRGKPLRRCSPTLRHRDHVHVSLSWPGARMRTSWYTTPAARRYR